MGLFRRSKATEFTQEPVAAPAETESPTTDSGSTGSNSTEANSTDSGVPKTSGPYDASDGAPSGPRADLGSILLPIMPGMNMRVEADQGSGRITGISVALGQSGLQVQAFAAPRSWGIWDEIREEIAAGLKSQGGTVDDVPGPFGRELIARIPGQMKDGRQTMAPARFIGVDGPRWFLRGVLSGKAAIDPEAAKALESVFANIVVVRDDTPRPPRDLLPLNMPGQGTPPAEPVDPEAEAEPSFNPLKRGPEITEIR